MVSAISRKVCKYYKVNNVNASPLTKKLSNLVNAIPYVFWTERLVDTLINKIELICSEEFKKACTIYHTADKNERKDAQIMYDKAGQDVNATEKFKKYLRAYFLNPKHQNGYTTWGYSTDDLDFTNNLNESCNHLLNCWCPKNVKTYRRAVSILYEYLADWVGRPAQSVKIYSSDYQ